jgi:tetratricopeptide (TPR) repeat protein
MKTFRIFLSILFICIFFAACVDTKEKAFECVKSGKTKFYANDFRAAIKDFSQALTYQPGFDQALFFRGNSYYNLGFVDSALADYNACIQASPMFADAYANRGSLKFDSGDRTGACQDWLKALEYGNESMGSRLENCQ